MRSKFLFTLLVPLLVVGCNNPDSPKDNKKIDYISVSTQPTTLSYAEGDYFDPTGLELAITYTNKDVDTVSYASEPASFTFLPSLTTKLEASDTQVQVTYKSKFTYIQITVTEEEKEVFTVDFTTAKTQQGTTPTTGDTDKTNFIDILNTYYFTDENVSLSSVEGEWMQIQTDEKKIFITETRSVDQLLILGSRTKDVDMTFKFNNPIYSISFVCEAYSKYIAYSDSYSVDHDTYLKVNGDKRDIAGHQASDVDETQTLKYVVQSDTVTIECPNDYVGEKSTNRIYVYQIIIEYSL